MNYKILTGVVALSLLILSSVVFTDSMSVALIAIRSTVLSDFGWLMNACVAISVFVGAYMAINPKLSAIKFNGKVSIGNFSWYGMCVSTVIGSSLFVWGVSEPSYHIKAGFDVTDAIARTMYNWGPAYIMFAVATACVAISKKNNWFEFDSKVLSLSVSTLVTIATAISIVSSFTIAASGVAGGIKTVAGVDVSQPALMAFFGAVSLASAKSGVMRGVKWFSNSAMTAGALIITAALLSFGMDTVKQTVESFTLMSVNIINYGFDTGINAPQEHNDWLFWWPHFYAAWWFTFLPFSVSFFAKISEGRTVREVILGVGVVPMIITCVLFGILGSTANISGITEPFELASSLDYLVGSSGLLVLAMCLWMITCVDSGSIALDDMTESKSKGGWIILITATSMGFQMFGGDAWNTLKIIIAILGLPICLLYIHMVYKALK